MLYHQTIAVGPTPVDRLEGFWAGGGWTGVDLFFVLSGFLITGVLLDAKGGDGYFRNFYARRILRIFPLYYAVVAFSTLILPHIPNPKVESFGRITGQEWWYWTYLSNGLIANYHAFRHGILDVSWSLAIEEQFYLVWPLMIVLLTQRALMRLCGALVLGAIVWRSALLVLGAHPVSIFVLTPGRVDALAIGAFIAVAARSDGQLALLRRFAFPVGVAATVVIVGLAIVGGGFDPYGAPFQVVGYTLLAVMFGSLVTLATFSSPTAWIVRGLQWAPLRSFGKYSYAMYLFHLPLRALVRDTFFGPERFPTVHGSPLPGLLMYYIVCTALAFAAAWLSWQLYERHFLSLKRFFVTGPAPVRVSGVVGQIEVVAR